MDKKILVAALAVLAVVAVVAVAAPTASADEIDLDSLTWTEVSGEYDGSNANGKNLRLVGDTTLTERLYYSMSGMTVYLDLNGYTLTADISRDTSITDGDKGGMIYLTGSNSILCIVDTSSDGSGVISNSGAMSYGNVAYITGTGNTLAMYGGTISGNSVRSNGSGGAIYAYTGTFAMYGGTISGNTATYGGAVHIAKSGTFAMYGGTISGNTATYGGAVSCAGTFAMYGGTISGNTATYGGAVHQSASTFSELIATDGTISGNTATYGGAVYTAYTIVISMATSVASSLTVGDIIAHASSDDKYLDSYLYYDANSGSFDISGAYGESIEVTVSSSVTQSISTTLTLPTNTPTRSGYTFAGWATSADASTTEYAAGETVTLDTLDTVTLYAVWNSALSISWSVSGAYSGASTAYILQIGSEVTVSATVTPADADDTSVIWTISDASMVDGATSTYTSYTFTPVATGEFTLTLTTSADDSVSVTLSFTVAYIAEIVYDSNGGSGAPDAEVYCSDSGDAVSVTLSETEPTLDGVRFVGWSDGSEVYAAGDIIKLAFSATEVSTLTLYAVWSDTYTLYLAYNDGSGDIWQTLTVSDTTSTSYTFTLPTDTPTRTGYAFVGWSTDADASTAAIQPGSLYTLSGSVESVTLYAVWSGVSYTIVYDSNGGSGAPSSVTLASTSESVNFTISTDTPTRTGYAFVGWSTDADASTAEYAAGDTIELAWTGDAKVSVTLYAVWSGVSYTIVYDSNGGSGAPSSVTYTDVVAATTTVILSSVVPTYGDYTFEGWYYGGTVYDSGGTFELAWTGESSVTYTLVAQWSAVVTLVYDSNGGSGAPDAESVTLDVSGGETSVTLTVSATEPTRSGYTFVGWSLTDISATTTAPSVYSAGDSIELTETVTLYAVWSRSVTLVYDSNGGSGAPTASSATVYTGSGRAYATVTVSATEPTRSGYTFVGWSDWSGSTSATWVAGDSLTASSDLTLYAVWSTTYTLTYDANGGEFADGSTTVTVSGESTTGYYDFELTSDLPTLDAHGFIGWSTEDDSRDGVTSGTVTVSESDAIVTLYAVWGATAEAAEIDLSGLTDGTLTLQIATSGIVTATVSGMSGTTYTLTWTVADESIAYITSGDGTSSITLYGASVGETTVTLTLTSGYDGSQQTVTFDVVVEGVSVTKIVISGSTSVTVGDSVTLKAVTYPSTATVRTVTWTVESDDATYSYSTTSTSTGGWITITGVSAGTVYVTATAEDGSGISATFELTVAAVTTDATVSISGYNTLVVGETNTYMAIVLPTSLSDRSATIEITNGSELVEATEVTLTDYGASISLTGLADGSVTLTAYYIVNGETVASASYVIAVVAYSESESAVDVAGSAVDILASWLGDNGDAAAIIIIAVVILALLVLLDNRWLAFLVGVPLAVVLSAMGILSVDLAAIVCVLAAAGAALVASGIFTGGKSK